MEVSINTKQAIAVIWTLIAIVVSLVIVLTMGLPFYGVYGGLGTYYGPLWQWLVALFFGLLLVITLPVYLLIVLWQILSKPNTD